MKLIILCFFCGSLFSQKINDKLFQEIRINIEEKSLPIPNYDINYSDSLLMYAKEKKSDKLLAEAYVTKAFVLLNNHRNEEALEFNTKSYEINQRQGNFKEIAKNYFIFGNIKSDATNDVKSIEYYLKSLEICLKYHMYVWAQKNYRSLSSTNLTQRDYRKALYYAKQAVEIAKKTEIKENVGNYLFLASAYLQLGLIDSANIIYKKTYDLSLKSSKHATAMVLSMWSLIYDETDIIKSIGLKLEAKKTLEVTDPAGTFASNNLANLGWMHYQLAQNDSLIKTMTTDKIPRNKALILDIAENYYQQSIALRDSLNDGLGSRLAFIKELAEIQAYKGDYKNAYNNLLISGRLNDSVFSQENKNAIAKLESQKEIELKNKEIELNKITLESKEKQKWFMVAGMALLGMIGFLLFTQSRNRKKTNVTLRVLNSNLDLANKTKLQFFNIINHDLRAPLASLIHFLHLKKNNPELLNEESSSRIENKTISSAENLMESMESILLWSKGQMEHFEPVFQSVSVDTLFKEIGRHFSNLEHIRIIFENAEDIYLITDEDYLKTILRNIISNATKVLSKTPNATIHIKSWKEKDKTLFSVSDNGPGAGQEKFKALYDDKEIVGIKTGLGLHLIRDMAKAIRCDITVESDPEKGTIFTLIL